MFERNRIDNGAHASAHQSAVAAVLTLSDGEVLSGHFVFSASRAISDVLNGEAQFVEFMPVEGARRFISKRAIRAVSLAEATTVKSMDHRRLADGEIDPHAALGVKRDAEWEEVRAAYLRLAKMYHADRYASVALPDEVREYLQQMSQRVNAAYTLLEAPRLVVRKADTRAAPVYESRPRV